MEHNRTPWSATTTQLEFPSTPAPSVALDEFEKAAAEKFWNAATRNDLIAPVHTGMRELGLAAGYRVQGLNVARAIAAGKIVAGYKVAMTSAAVQRQFGVAHPVSGVVFADSIVDSGAMVKAPAQGRVEAEVAFRMSCDVGPAEPTLDELTACIARALPAIEIVSCRVRHWDVTPFDFVADNAAASWVVAGDDTIDCDPEVLAGISMRMRINNEVRATGHGAQCAIGPLQSLRWLAMHLARGGRRLRAGEVVMSGSLGPAIDIGPGDRVDVSVGAARPVCVQFC